MGIQNKESKIWLNKKIQKVPHGTFFYGNSTFEIEYKNDMAKKKTTSKKIVCSFCIESFLPKDILTVRLPMYILANGETQGTYKTACCKSCSTLPETQSRIIEIVQAQQSGSKI